MSSKKGESVPTPYDPRAIANLLLDQAAASRLVVTNLGLQKLLYFTYSKFLIERGESLFKGVFEAWKFGPVNPVVYDAFKAAGDQPIEFRVQAFDRVAQRPVSFGTIEEPEVFRVVQEVLATFGRLSAGRLVDIAHAPGAPWDFVVRRAKDSVSLGMRITDAIILERFKFHKVSVTEHPRVGEPNEDAPLTRHRSG